MVRPSAAPRHLAGWHAAAAGLVLAGLMVGLPAANAQDLALRERDLEIDAAMGLLRPDPVLMRLLTTEPLMPWHRGEQPFKQQPPAAQFDFRPVSVVPVAPVTVPSTMAAVMGAMGGGATVAAPTTPVVMPVATPATPATMTEPPPANERDAGGGTDGDGASPGR